MSGYLLPALSMALHSAVARGRCAARGADTRRGRGGHESKANARKTEIPEIGIASDALLRIRWFKGRAAASAEFEGKNGANADLVP